MFQLIPGGPLGKSRFPFLFRCVKKVTYVTFLFSLSLFLSFSLLSFSLSLFVSVSSHLSHLPHLSHLAYPPAHLFFDLVSHPITHFVFHVSLSVSVSTCMLLTVCRQETQTSTSQRVITRHSTASQLSSARTDMMEDAGDVAPCQQ